MPNVLFISAGEAQKIDRMMDTFAQRYCQLNPDIFTNSDTCYVLSFAIIMLNTSLHNPSVKVTIEGTLDGVYDGPQRNEGNAGIQRFP